MKIVDFKTVLSCPGPTSAINGHEPDIKEKMKY